MGEVVNLNVVRRVPIESQTLISFALLREIRNRIDGLNSGVGFVHLRDADTELRSVFMFRTGTPHGG